MPIEIGNVEAMFRYPVKSMAGEQLDVAELGWYGIEGDRRLAFRRIDDHSGTPWLTASKLPDLLLFGPHRRKDDAEKELSAHVRTPDGEDMPVFGEDLAREVQRRYGAPVQMMQLRHGIFDEAPISVIASDTVREIGRLAGQSLNVRRFRRILSFAYCGRARSRRTSGWAVCSHSAKGMVRPPLPSPCATNAARW